MTAQVHNHLHLDTDNPPTATYTALQRNPMPKIIIDMRRGLTGKLIRQTFSSGGSVVQFTDYVYQLKVTQAELNTIIGLLGENVYLIDNIHDDDDQASYSKAMVLRALKGISHEGVASKATLDYFRVTIELEDNNSVT